jgi:hypothetical protein
MIGTCLIAFAECHDVFREKELPRRSFRWLKLGYNGQTCLERVVVATKKVRNKFAGFGSGSICKRHGSVDLDPYQKVTVPQYCIQLLVNVFYCTAIVANTCKFEICIINHMKPPYNICLKDVLKMQKNTNLVYNQSIFTSTCRSGISAFIPLAD